MKIKKIKSLKVNCWHFKVIWDKSHNGASFCYGDMEIIIGVKSGNDEEIHMLLCHELMEIAAIEEGVRFRRSDCDDYIFMYDHRQHTTMMCVFAGLLSQFIA